MKIELIRHGETALQAEKRYQGATDEPLSPEGRRKLKRAETSPERVYVTPLRRTNETAAILFPGARQIVVPELAEMNFGVFEGRSAAEMAEDPAYREWVEGFCLGRCPGGESKEEFCRRVCAAFADLVRREEDNPLVIVAHGGVQMAVMERFAEEQKDYWKWMLPGGRGYLLELCRPEIRLRVLEIRDYTQEEFAGRGDAKPGTGTTKPDLRGSLPESRREEEA